MNFLKRLFSHHPQAGSTSSSLMNWPGQSGKQYQYEVYPIGTSFQPMPGNFIYAAQSEDGTWVPVYIAQSRDMRQRLEGHVSAQDAMARGATHIHAHYCPTSQSARCSEERDLVLQWRPVCNDLPEN